MANKGSIITYQYPILGGGIGCSYSAGSSPSYTWDIAKSTFNWSIASQDVVNNKTTFSWSLAVQFYNNTGTASIDTLSVDEIYIYDSTQKYNKVTLHYDGNAKTVARGKTVTVASGTLVFDHEDDGTLTFPLELKVYMSAGSYYSNYAIEATNSITLDTISRHALIYSAHDFTDEDTVAISYAVPSGITGYIYLSLDGNANTETTALKAVTGAGTYNYSFSEADQKKLWTIQDQGLITKRVRFFIKSTSNIDGLTYREPSAYVNLTIKDYMPTLDPEVWDSNEDCVTRLTGNKYILVKGVSNASFTTGGQAHKGATIDAQTTFNAGIPKTGPSGVYEKVTSNVFDFSIVDSYGRTTPATMEFDRAAGRFVDYVKLTCNVEVTEMTADGDIQATITGKCFTGNFGAKTNRLRVFYDIVKNNEDEFEHVDLGYADLASNYGNSFYTSGSDYTYTLNISGLEYLSVYDLKVWVADEVATAGVPAEAILASTPIFDWGRQDFNFNVPVTIQGGMVPTIVEQGTHWSGWNYRKWSDGLAECWMTLEVTAAVNTATNASWYSSGELSATNLSFPFTFISRPSVTVQTMPTGQSWCIVFPSNTTGSTTKTGSYQLNSMSSTTSRKHLLAYDVKGYWY